MSNTPRTDTDTDGLLRYAGTGHYQCTHCKATGLGKDGVDHLPDCPASTSQDAADGLLARIVAMEALCAKATPGEWSVDSDPGDGDRPGYCHVDGWTDHGEDWMNLDITDARFIAAHDPDRMRAVWAVVRAAERRRLARSAFESSEIGTREHRRLAGVDVRAEEAENLALIELAARMGTGADNG